MLEKRECKNVAWIIWFYILVVYFFMYCYGVVDEFIGLGETFGALFTIFISIVGSVGGIGMARLLNKFHFNKRDFKKVKTTLYILPVFILIMGFNLANGILLQLLGSIFHFSVTNSTIVFTDNYFYDVLMFIAAAIVAPIFEELLFRGVFLRSLAKYNRMFAIVTSSLLFGLMHMDLSQIFYAFVLGLVFASISLEYDSMVPNIILHSLNNLWAVCVTLLYQISLPAGVQTTIEYIISSMMVFGLFYCLWFVFSKRNEFDLTQIPGKYMKWTFLNVPMLLFIVFCMTFAVIGVL